MRSAPTTQRLISGAHFPSVYLAAGNNVRNSNTPECSTDSGVPHLIVMARRGTLGVPRREKHAVCYDIDGKSQWL